MRWHGSWTVTALPMSFLCILFAACFLDLLLGDPRRLPHPVRLIGSFAARMETLTRRLPLSERGSGCLTVVVVLCAVAATCAVILFIFTFLPDPLVFPGTAFLLYTSIAARDLLDHASAVHTALDKSIEAARQQVGLIVGRDTSQMDEAAIIRACVESVAENMSDGIIAPLFWATAGAALALALPAAGSQPAAWAVLAAMLYKAVSTMDSMFGYKNKRYQHFGCCPAKLDDAANFFPARISGLAIVVAALFCGGNMQQSWRTLRQDCRNHASPNSGWPEAAAAGALGIQLGGEAMYFGRTVSKPLLGQALVPPQRQHILRICHTVLTASFLCLFLFATLFALLLLAF